MEIDMLSNFAETYAEAREKFLDLARSKNAFLHSVTHPGLGANGEEMAMDFAVFGPRDAERTLLLVSGTHGQEGYTGSAIQIGYLRDLEIPVGVNVIALHGLNPWGFSHLSRSDELNIDNNRNFLDFDNPPPANPIYCEMHAAICPDDWNANIPAQEIVQPALDKYGPERTLSAVSGGQFEEATGLNFGGRAPSWSNRTVHEHLLPLLESAKKIAFIEWHTGLGEYGKLSHVCFHPLKTPSANKVWEWMGEDAKASLAASMQGTDSIGEYRGPFAKWLPTAVPHAECAGLVIEVGTFDNNRVWESLRLDRWLRFGGGASPERREELRREMLEGLYPSSPEWRRSALKEGIGAQERVLRGLVSW